jgi:hypothetical protein
MNNPFKKKTKTATYSKKINKFMDSMGVLYLAFWICWALANIIADAISKKKAVAATAA